MWKIPLFDLDYDEKEQAAVRRVLHSKWLTSGPETQKFEANFSTYLGAKITATAVANGTAALHLSLLALGIEPNDEIIISGLSFVAALNIVSLCGAKPVLADCKSFDDWNVDPNEIANKITNKTRAIIIVHFAGYPCDMDEISEICRKHNLRLIEDVAHAVGGTYRGRQCGTFGDIACFSFFSNKNLSVGEGGMVVTKEERYNQKLRLLRSHGMTSLTVERHQGKTISYDVLQPGFNYRFDEIRAAIGIEQLAKLDFNNKKRRVIVEAYQRHLSSIGLIKLPWIGFPEYINPSYHIFPILLDRMIDRNVLINDLKDSGVQTSIHYPAYRAFSYYSKSIKEVLPIADQISKRVLTLPLYPGMEVEQVMYIQQKIIKHINKNYGNDKSDC